jgi:hypothetical protein
VSGARPGAIPVVPVTGPEPDEHRVALCELRLICDCGRIFVGRTRSDVVTAYTAHLPSDGKP